MIWKVFTSDKKFVALGPNALIQSLLGSAFQEDQDSTFEAEAQELITTYERDFLASLIGQTPIRQIAVLAFIIGRKYERFMQQNNVTIETRSTETT